MGKRPVLGGGVWLVLSIAACGSQGGSTGTGGTQATGAGATSTTAGASSATANGAGGGSATGTAATNGATGASTTTGAVTASSSASMGSAVTAAGGSGGSTSVSTNGSTTDGSGAQPNVPEPSLVTSGQDQYWVEGELVEGGGNATVTVNENTTFQEWRGFGGTFNEAGWDALAVLDAAERDRAIGLLFSDHEGAGFDWGRIPIGASDYALVRYTLAETANDLTMEHFSIERDRQYLIPYVKAALTVKSDVRLWASPWSPPAWMKDSNNIDGTDEYEGTPATFTSHMRSDPAILEAYALYFARFVEEYAAEGLTIHHIQPQNEPGYATRYPSCLWDAGLLGTFVGSYLAPTLAERGLNTEIWFGTLSNNDTYASHINGLTGNAGQAVVGVGLQWNTIPHVGELVGQGYQVMQTEHRCGNYPWEGGFNPNQPPNDHAYAEESWGLIKQWLEAGVHIYSAWNMVLDTEGKNLDVRRPWPQNALLVVDRAARTLTATPAYYVFRHLSQFVDPGAVRLGTTGGNALAFRNPDSSVVTVLYNQGNQASPTTLAVGGTTLEFTIPARGWATVNYGGPT